MKEDINEWLDSCPKPVTRVITDAVDLRFLAASAYAYEDNTLVVTTLETLKALIFKQTTK